MDCSPPGSSVHGILQARILEWVAIPFSRRSSLPRDWTWVSPIAGRFFTTWANREVHFSLLMFTHRSTKANLFNGINLLSHHIVNNTFSQLGEDHSEGSFSDDVAPDEIERGFPCNRLRRQPHSPSPEKRSLSVFFLFYCMSPGEDPWDTQGSIPQENLGTTPHAEGLGEGMAHHSSILAWKIPRTEETSGLQSTGSQRVGHNWACRHAHTIWINFQGSMVSKWIQSQKRTCCLSPFTWLSVKDKTTVMKSRSVVGSI